MDEYEYDEAPRYTTHPKAVAGIMVMASIMLFSVVFAITLVLAGVFVPPRTAVGVLTHDAVLSDYLTFGRVLVATVAGLVITVLFWYGVPGD